MTGEMLLPMPFGDEELRRLHDCFVTSVLGNSDATAERILSLTGNTVEDFVRGMQTGLVVVSLHMLPEPWYQILLRAEVDTYKAIPMRIGPRSTVGSSRRSPRGCLRTSPMGEGRAYDTQLPRHNPSQNHVQTYAYT